MDNPYQASAASVGAAAPLGVSYFKNPALLTLATRIFLGLGILTSLCASALALHESSLMGEYSATDSLDDIYDQMIIPMMLLGLVQSVAVFGSFVIIAMWIYRMAWNARYFAGASHMEYTPGWAVGWYFIPIATLWKPYQAMKEIWRASDDPAHMRLVSIPFWLPLWWCLWLVNNILSNVSARLTFRAEIISEGMLANRISILVEAVNIVLCLVFLVVVNRLSRMQWRQQSLRQAQAVA